MAGAVAVTVAVAVAVENAQQPSESAQAKRGSEAQLEVSSPSPYQASPNQASSNLLNKTNESTNIADLIVQTDHGIGRQWHWQIQKA
jgi:hypothetical protein